jgi:DNA-directed RNA polymerase specialized sigma24 family protein
MNWDRIEPWDYIVAHVADEYHRKYTMVERDDIRQALYEWFVLHPNNFAEWEKLTTRSTQNLLYRSLRNYALDYCQLWKAKSIGYEPSDLFYYESDVIEALLPTIFMGAEAEAPKLNLGMPGRPSAPSEGGNVMAMMAEIKSAFMKLNEEDKNILYLRYSKSLDYGSIAKTLELPSDDAARMRNARAIKKIINKLGGFRAYLEQDGPDDVGDSDEPTEEYTEADE